MTTCQRNYRVVGLEPVDDHYEVMILVEGKEDPHSTGCPVSEFVDVFELDPDGIFGYYDDEEVAILMRGVTKEGEDKDPRTGRRRGTRRARPTYSEEVPDGRQTCRMCEAEKPLSEFSRYSKSKTGFRNYCKECASAAARMYLERAKRREGGES